MGKRREGETCTKECNMFLKMYLGWLSSVEMKGEFFGFGQIRFQKFHKNCWRRLKRI